MKTLPDNVPALIKQLDAVFPLKTFPPNATLSDVHRACGQRDVVEFLKTLQKEAVDGMYEEQD